MRVFVPVFMAVLGVVVFLRLCNKPTASKTIEEKSWDEWFDGLDVSPDFMTDRDQWRRTK